MLMSTRSWLVTAAVCASTMAMRRAVVGDRLSGSVSSPGVSSFSFSSDRSTKPRFCSLPSLSLFGPGRSTTARNCSLRSRALVARTRARSAVSTGWSMATRASTVQLRAASPMASARPTVRTWPARPSEAWSLSTRESMALLVVQQQRQRWSRGSRRETRAAMKEDLPVPGGPTTTEIGASTLDSAVFCAAFKRLPDAAAGRGGDSQSTFESSKTRVVLPRTMAWRSLGAMVWTMATARER
mmetsp:Transcript_16911/g.57233  ORF Transcript_16911/g.57233 Transcript_16911/m.57233 type:complete len:241 (-) Transcript_16911:650-1372(-)